jgi:hypothetical protein
MTEWSGARLKTEQFDDIDFDHIVTDDAIRRFLGYSIPENKRTMTKRVKTKKNSRAPKSHQQPTEKRVVDPETLVSEEVAPKRKKQKSPLSASISRRAPLKRAEMRPIEERS